MHLNSMKNFREFTSPSGIKILAGKSAESNEALVKQVGDNEFVFHTAAPGSPFVNIKADADTGKVKIEDIQFAAVICARYSQVWKKSKRLAILVDKFLGKDIFKTKEMKLGTFGIKRCGTMIVFKNKIEEFIKLKEKK